MELLGGDPAPSLGGRTKIGRPKFSFLPPKISYKLFLFIDFIFRILPVFTVSNILCDDVYGPFDPFFSRKPLFHKKILHDTFFSFQFVLSQPFFSKYWGVGCMGRPPPQILGGPSHQFP